MFTCLVNISAINELLFFPSPCSICNKIFLFQVIGINKQFPGPILNVTTNWNVVVNVKNDLDEPLLLHW